MTKYKHIIWDWNGTLMDDVWLCVDVINSLLKAHSINPVAVEDYRQHFEFPVIRFYKTLGFDLETTSFEAVSHAFISHYDQRRHECQLHPQAETILRSITAAGITQSILSAYTQEKLTTVVCHFGIDHYFNTVVGLDNIYAAGKLEQGKLHITQLDCLPSEVLLIGDTLHDYEVASEIGADCILVSHGHNDHQRLLKCPVPVIEDFSAISSLLL